MMAERQQTHSEIQDFIMEQHQRQQNQNGEADTDPDRTAGFFARALSESNRMNQEVEKSQQKLQDLHADLGAANFEAWQQEHAREVLPPAQQQGLAQQNGVRPAQGDAT